MRLPLLSLFAAQGSQALDLPRVNSGFSVIPGASQNVNPVSVEIPQNGKFSLNFYYLELQLIKSIKEVLKCFLQTVCIKPKIPFKKAN